MNNIRFRVGDRVKIRENIYGDSSSFPKGTGTIRIVHNSSMGVEFDKKFDRGHSCEGKCKKGYGYWLSNSYITPLAPNWKRRFQE